MSKTSIRELQETSLFCLEREKPFFPFHTSKSFKGRRFIFMVLFCFFVVVNFDLIRSISVFSLRRFFLWNLFDVVLINSSHLLIGSDINFSPSFIPIPVIND